ncbi:hypothetical protein BJ123_109125 [Rhodopseudomonas thermotolerans]|uniref:Uncharacterized protein n=2 Tax=Rhodopseudomonas TaxID=1073 RepID=A0A336JYC5_9BRAD|nr:MULTISPECIES: hypothetical protein [Rhodopseudomonas]RED35281.1 hypothetical protein BJ125_109125 [Rhodopseudomonas pentothenatexigens]REG03124.1 hypothetical protein BJ123_109125 [Rhodopseudomonas thermotolerans]SSW90971.1 hypothetical protein SAMN05892882_109125 [Rhodopseudomonas pentothenatexigens]
MTQIIARLYDSSSRLSALESDLKSNNLKYTVVTSGRSSVEEITAALAKAGVSRSEAATYADYVRKGGVVVAAQAEFGFGAKATKILDSYGPNPISLKSSSSRAAELSDAAPFSNMIHAPVLLGTSGPYKSYSGDLLLVDSDKTFSGTPLVISSDGPYQSFSGTPLLLDSSGPYKSFSGTPLLLDTSGPYKSYSGEPLLINNATPFSSWLGLPVLL